MAMGRFIRLCLILWSSILLLAVSSLQFGRLFSPKSEVLASLHLDECQLPCWRGIEPQITTLDTVIAILSKNYQGKMIWRSDTRDGLIELGIVEGDWGIFVRCIKTTDHAPCVVDRITFSLDWAARKHFRRGSLTIGDLSQVVGSPEEIALRNTGLGDPPIVLFLKNRSIYANLSDSICNGTRADQAVVEFGTNGEGMDYFLESKVQIWHGYKTCYELQP